jgi:hypothetical protein
MEQLHGGRPNQILRDGNAVRRPAGFWSPTIHALLTHVHQTGFHRAPQPLGYDDDGNELLTFIPGEVSNYPLSANAASKQALTSAAVLLRGWHDATVSFLAGESADYKWYLPPREPFEVICHGDFAPYNVVLQGNTASAIIDFDTAHPAPRVWDIAYALYRWAPLMRPDNLDGFGTLSEQGARARRFCDSYGLSKVQRTHLIDVVIERLQTLVDFMQTEADAGNVAFQANLADGHHLGYLADIAYLRNNQAQIEAILREDVCESH